MPDFKNLDVHSISTMNRQEFQAVLGEVMSAWELDRKENAIYHYVPVSDSARKIHLSTAQTIGIGGGNGASKTEGSLAELIMCCTGRIPMSLLHDPNKTDHRYTFEGGIDPKNDPANFVDPDVKLRGPINCRIVCESLTNVLANVILPKLKWWEWTGVDAPGGERGHWGWIPRDCLVGGSWDKSWSEKYRTLKILYHDPKRGGRVTGTSTIQFNSRDQDASDFASGDFHIVLHDEPPTYAIWRENQARTMRVRGRMMLAMTWPDDPSIPVDWLFDEVYEPATATIKNPAIEWINLYTTDNANLDQGAVALQMAQWGVDTVSVRIKGQPIRFSNRVHALFTDQEQNWCFNCDKPVPIVDAKCGQCESATWTEFCHVGDYPPEPNWPTVFLLDPHPRKPHMFSWWQVSPSDDLVQVAEGECEGDPTAVREMCDALEMRMGLNVTFRYIDPNMGRSPASAKRGITWQDEFEFAGLHCDLAEDSDVGRKRIDEYLKPCASTQEPRIRIDRGCPKTVNQMKRYVWDDYKISLEKSQKQTPKDKNDDYPTLMKYLLNADPTFHFMAHGATLVRRMRAPAQRHAARMSR